MRCLLPALLFLAACAEPTAIHPDVAALPDAERRKLLEGLDAPVDGVLRSYPMELVTGFEGEQRDAIVGHIESNWPAYAAAREAIPRTELDEAVRRFGSASDDLAGRFCEEDFLHPADAEMAEVLNTHLPASVREGLLATDDRGESDRAQSAVQTALYTAAPATLLDFVEKLLAARAERGWAEENEPEVLYNMAASTGDITRAERLAATYPGLPESLPIDLDLSGLREGERRVFAVDAEGTMTPEVLNFTGFTGVVGLGSPYCAPCKRSNAWFTANPDALAGHDAVWLEALARAGDPKVAGYNRENPSFALRYPGPRAQWPEVNSWAAPGFFVLHNGKVVGKVTGWADDAQGEKLAALLDGTF